MKEENRYPKDRKCPECGSKSIITDSIHAELFCADCGVVIEENIVDLGPEWREYEEKQFSKKARTGSLTSYKIYGKGLGAPLAKSVIPVSLRKTINTVNNEGRSLFFALLEISRMASALGLPNDTKEEASLLFRKAVKRNLIKGHSIESIAAAALYIASKMHKIPRTLKEIEEILGSKKINAKKINQEHIYLLEKLKLKVPRSRPIEYLARFCSELDLNADILSKTTEICSEAEKAKIASIKYPERTAAASILAAISLNDSSVV